MVLEFGSLLRLCRSDWSLRQKEMAELLSVSQPVYSRIETGERPIFLRSLEQIAAQAGVSVPTLIFAHLLLDEHLEMLESAPNSAANRSLLKIANEYKNRLPANFENAATVGLLYEGKLD